MGCAPARRACATQRRCVSDAAAPTPGRGSGACGRRRRARERIPVIRRLDAVSGDGHGAPTCHRRRAKCVGAPRHMDGAEKPKRFVGRPAKQAD
jgi:hypothetical protein